MKVSSAFIDFMQKMGVKPNITKETAQEKIREDAQRILDIDAELREAAATGDQKRFEALTDEKKKREASMSMYRMQISEAPDYYTRQAVTGAWEKYAQQHNKTFSKKYAEYKKARAALAEQCAELLLMQNDALRARDTCWLALFENDNIKDTETRRVLTEELDMARSGQMPETAFFSSTGDWARDIALVYDQIARGNTASEEDLEHPESLREVFRGAAIAGYVVPAGAPAAHISMRATGTSTK